MAGMTMGESGGHARNPDVPPPGGVVGGFIAAVDGLTRAAGYLAMGIILVMVGLICVELALLHLFDRSLMFMDDVVGQLVAVFAFLAIGFCLRERALIRVEVIHARLRGLTLVLVEIFYSLASLLYAGVLGFYVLRLVMSSYTNKVVSMSSLEAPMWIPQAVLPIGMAILILAIIADLLGQIHTLRGLLAARRRAA